MSWIKEQIKFLEFKREIGTATETDIITLESLKRQLQPYEQRPGLSEADYEYLRRQQIKRLVKASRNSDIPCHIYGIPAGLFTVF